VVPLVTLLRSMHARVAIPRRGRCVEQGGVHHLSSRIISPRWCKCVDFLQQHRRRLCTSSSRRNFSTVVVSGASSCTRSSPRNCRMAVLLLTASSSPSSDNAQHCFTKYSRSTHSSAVGRRPLGALPVSAALMLPVSATTARPTPSHPGISHASQPGSCLDVPYSQN